MSRFRDVAGDLIPDLLCAFAQLGEAPIDFGNRVRDGITGGVSDPDGTAAGFESPIQKALCGLGGAPNRIDFDVPPAAVPGSCDAQYRLYANITYVDRTDFEEKTARFGSDNQFPGPLGDAIGVTRGTTFVITFSNTNGEIFGPSYAFNEPTFVLDLERVDGQPDNCGSDGQPLDPTGPQPGDPPSGTGDVDYTDEDGNPVTEPYTFDFRTPFTDRDGDTIVPVEICLDGECYQFCYNLNTGATQSCSQGPENDPCCPAVDPIAVEPGPDDPPPPENDERYAGLLIRILDASLNKTATRVGSDGPTLYIPRLAAVRFAVEVGGRRMWTVDQPLKTTPQGIFVNAPALAYAWDIIEEPGVTLDVTPIIAPDRVLL